jgi:hypothetical protein
LWLVISDDLSMIQSASSDRVANNERRRFPSPLSKAGARWAS